MIGPSTFTISPASQTGKVYSTNFKFDGSAVTGPFVSYLWDFGDGKTKYDQLTAEHVYSFPGEYVVSLSAWTAYGYFFTDTATVQVDYSIRDVLIITSYPSSPGTAGVYPLSADSFTVSVTSAQIVPKLDVILHAENSKSVPFYSIKNKKWKHIIPHWKFIQKGTNAVIEDSITLPTSEIKDAFGTVIAVSASESFYYYDDLPTDPVGSSAPLKIKATLDTSKFRYVFKTKKEYHDSYSNNETVKDAITWKINSVLPTKLAVTENGINDIYSVKWLNVPIPFLITCKKNSAVGSINAADPTILSYPNTNATGALNQVSVTLLSAGGGTVPSSFFTVEVDSASYSPGAAPLFFKKHDTEGNLTTGYIFTTVTPLSPISGSVTLSVSTVATDGTLFQNISGQSASFTVLDLERDVPTFVKKNETFNPSDYFKSLAFTEHLSKNALFFDELVPAIVGNDDPSVEGIGRIVYERIANFVQTHGDADTMEIDQLLGAAESLSLMFQHHGVSEFPREIKRLLDLFSVNKHYLRGFKQRTPELEEAIGLELTLSDTLTAGTDIFMKDIKYQNTYKVSVTPLSASGSLVYPVSSIELDGTRTPIHDNYSFHPIIPSFVGYTGNIIDWDSPFTTLSFFLSGDNDWYGDDGLLELTFNSLLTKRLFS